MQDLSVNIEVLDFDLETIGFNFDVINPDTAKPKSNSYFRMSLIELNVFIKALKASAANINLAAPNSVTGGKSKASRSPKTDTENIRKSGTTTLKSSRKS